MIAFHDVANNNNSQRVISPISLSCSSFPVHFNPDVVGGTLKRNYSLIVELSMPVTLN